MPPLAAERSTQNTLASYRLLILNSDHRPIHAIPWMVGWEDAVRLLFGERKHLYALEQSNIWVHSVTTSYRLPLVVAYYEYQSEENIFGLAHYNEDHLYLRDRGVCQYSGKRVWWKAKDPDELATVEHIQPQADDGPKRCWFNTVIASSRINGLKGRQSLDEFGYPLLNKPFKPRLVDLQARYLELNMMNMDPAHAYYVRQGLQSLGVLHAA